MLKTGDKAVNFELPDYKGGRVKLFDLLGQHAPLMLIFYKNSCPTCQYTFKHLPRIAREVGPENFLAIAQDTPIEGAEFRKQYQFDFNIACDVSPYPVSVIYSLEVVPTFFVIEADKTISLIGEGFDKLAIDDFARRIAVSRGLQNYQAFQTAEYIPLLKPG